ncbi:SLC13 family permease [Sedimenticola sp.]|uniref:SLC13 family permease n=1 Tax=Sedimenticola sp. TaxID=1940285 RepID=UPI003D0E0C78
MELPAPPDPHGLAVLFLVVVALALFTRERIPLETSSLAVLVLLAVAFELFPYQAAAGQIHAIDFFMGFGHEALVAVCALMIAGQGLVRTGALEPVGRQLARLWTVSPMLSLLLTLLIGALLSAFVNNVPIVVLLLPILISVSLRSNRPASSILMPMGFATLVGGMSTTIGTSTNLLVVSVASDMGIARFSMFHFFLPAAIAGGLAILFLWLIAPRLLPRREGLMEDTSPRVFTAQLSVDEESFAADKTLAELNEAVGMTLKVMQVYRGESTALTPFPDVVIRPGDRLGVKDTPDNLKEMETVLGAKLYTGDVPVDEEHPLQDEDQQLAEIVVTQGSSLEGSTLSRLRFADYYQLATLALHRAGAVVRTLREEVGDIRLNIGDVLLVQGNREQIAKLKHSGELLVLDATSDLPSTKRAPLALTIMAAVVLAAALGLLPIAISAVCGVLLMVSTRCLSWRDAAQALNTQVILIVVASLALGMALSKTGGADYLARLFVSISDGSSPTVMLSGLMLLMAVLTNIVSNNAAAVIGTPIAISIAQQLGLSAEPFVLAVLFGANMSYATPMAYKTNLLVMNAGGYQFNDFVRVGVPLTLIVWLALSWLLPMLYLG